MPPENAITTLGWLARGKALAAKSYAGAAEHWLAANGAPAQAQRIFKTAIGAGTTADSDLGDYGISIGAWSDSLRTRSAFYRILADGGFTRVPMRTRVAITTVPATGSVVGEGAAMPLSRVTLQNLQLEPIRASALIVVSDELLQDISAAGQQLLNRELAGAVSDTVDGAFLNLITSTATPSTASTGTTAAAAWADLRAALLAVSAVGSTRIYAIAAPDVAVKASTLATADGVQAFVAASPSGGEIGNAPLLVSSGCPAGSLYILNAAAICADGGPVTVDASSQADISMLDDPTMNAGTSTAASMVSMWQSNSTALKANAIFGAEVLRDNAVAAITGIDWGA